MNTELNEPNDNGGRKLVINIAVLTIAMAVVSIAWWVTIGNKLDNYSYLILAFFAVVWLGAMILIINPKSPIIEPSYKADNLFKNQSKIIYYVISAIILLITVYFLVGDKYPNGLSKILSLCIIFGVPLVLFIICLYIVYNFIFHKVPFVPLGMVNMVNDNEKAFLTKPVQYCIMAFFIISAIGIGYYLIIILDYFT